MKITILHPFTAQSVGITEENVLTYHSQPHVKAMQMLSNDGNYECSIEYFTPKMLGYEIKKNKLKWQFYPVSKKLNGDHNKWKKQVSFSCLRNYKKNTPDITIINMSGHSSPFSFELSKIIQRKNKSYVAMLGGQHYTDTSRHREYYKNAHHILVHTFLQKKMMEKMDMFKDTDIRVFPLGVDCNTFKPSDNLNDNKKLYPNLLYVGRIVEWKRIHLAIETMHKLLINGFRSAYLNIIGPASSISYLNHLKELIKSYKLENHVQFLGHKEHAELPKYFQEADLFLLPSDKETFGMVMIESMACGTPVAGIDCPGGPAEVITNGINGLLSTPDTYSQDILNLCLKRDKLKKMKVEARMKAVNEYSIDATKQVLFESVASVLN